jgi:DNA segregation ATPase FtsK/SpoIIIE, S-DNA-T family
MQLRLTLTGSGRSVLPVDLQVVAPRGTTVSELQPHLAPWLPPSRQLSVNGHPLPGSAPLGDPPLVHGAVLSDSAPCVDDDVLQGVLQVRVIGGPDAGAVHRLLPGKMTIGRAAGNVVRVEDPDVSRVHAAITSDPSGLTVRDLDSTNGTFVDEVPVTTSPVKLMPGQLLRVGNSTLTVVVPGEPAAATSSDGQGHLLVNRAPRIRPPLDVVRLRYPTEPPRRDVPRFPWLAIALPLLLGAVMFVVTKSETMWLAFILLSPMMLIGNAAGERVIGRRRQRQDRRAYEQELADLETRAATAVAHDAAQRRSQSPDPAALLLRALQPQSRLWERRRNDDDFLSLRIGTGDVPSDVVVEGAGTDADPLTANVPVVVPLHDVGVLGIAGARAQVEGLGRWLVGQLAALHSPQDVRLVLLADQVSVDAWSWTRWLPHLLPQDEQDCTLLVGLDDMSIAARVNELVALVDARQETAARNNRPWTGPVTVVVIEGARRVRAEAGVPRLLAEGPAVGIYAVCLSITETDLPAECVAMATAGGEVGTQVSLRIRSSPVVTGITADCVPMTWAQRLARALAPLRDATPADRTAVLPTSACLLDELDLKPCADALLQKWQAIPRSTSALLGIDAVGAFQVDLSVDGPHVLVAGTTGSGKSELLQTLVCSLAICNRPDEMVFILVDYKGGSAFGDCSRLPHCVGLVTDLDEHLTERALASLDAELKRRECVLRDAATKDIETYQQSPDRRNGAALPRLVLVIDEFAALAKELPHFMRGLVDIAQRGRSLGVHLVLATQRPSGVVSSDIRANTGIRIALRVTDATESSDIIDVKDAAFISRDTPGRAYARLATGGATAFQCARVGGHRIDRAGPEISLRREDWRLMGAPPLRTGSPTTSGPTDLSLLVDAAVAASTSGGIAPPANVWLPPLPTTIALDELPAIEAGDVIPLGVCDLPSEQTQRPFSIDLAHGGHVLIVGGSRSGRTTTLRTAAGSAARFFAPWDCHMYVLDCASGALSSLASLPHCGATVIRDETERGTRLLSRLMDEVVRRQEALRRTGFSSVAEQRRAVRAEERLPWMLLIVDGWDGLQTAYDGIDNGYPIDTMMRLLREGSAVGLRVIVTGGRSALVGRINSLVAERLVLRMADPVDYSLVGLSPRSIPTAIPPGRGLLASGSVETQIALLALDPAGPAQLAALNALAAIDHGPTQHRAPPIRVEPLPEDVPFDLVAARAGALAAERGPYWAPIGIGGDDASPQGVDLQADGPAFVIAGPPRSGRSSLLVALVQWLAGRGVSVAVVAPRKSPLRQVSNEPGLRAVSDGYGIDALQDAVETASGPLVLVADDAEMLLDSPAERVLLDVLKDADSGAPRAVVVAGTTDSMTATYRGITVEARRSGCGLLLSPSGPLDGELLGVRVPRASEQRSGRGILVVDGHVQPVQAMRGRDY